MFTSEKTTIPIEKSVAEEINHILTVEPKNADECFGEDLAITNTAHFDNGIEIDIKCCGVQYDELNESNVGWTEAVIFKNGSEVMCSEPSDEYFGEWYLEYHEDEYIVNVIVIK